VTGISQQAESAADCFPVENELRFTRGSQIAGIARSSFAKLDLIMPQDSSASPQVVSGLIVKDSPLVAALIFLVVALVITPAGVLAVHAWWAGRLFFGIEVAGYGALIGLGGIVAGLFSVAGLINTFLMRDYLVIGDDCLQQVQYGQVIVQIPFANVSCVVYGEHSLLGEFVSFSLIDCNDRQTIIADRLRQPGDADFRMYDTGWQMPLQELQLQLESRLRVRAHNGVPSALGGMNARTGNRR
jgi:hypothetical protein